jgi:hypothetical protein
MTITDAIQSFFGGQDGQAAIAVLLVAFVDFSLGTAAALRDGRFELSNLAAFLRKHVMARVLPIWILLFASRDTSAFIIGDLDALSALGLAAAAAYVLETVGSIRNAWDLNLVKAKPLD